MTRPGEEENEPLTRAFLSVSATAPADRAELERVLTDAVSAAHAAHPSVRVSDETLVRFIAERVDDEDAIELVKKLCVDDLLVACGCLDGDRAALEIFDRVHLGGVQLAVQRIDPSPAFADEIKQQMRVSLLLPREGQPKRLATYRGTGRLASWIKVGAVRTALEQRRKSKPTDTRSDDELMHAADLDDDPELAHVRQLYRSEFADAFKESLAELTSRERNVLRMYLMDGLNIEQIGAVYRVHRATVARWIARARDELLAATRKRLVAKLKLTTTQFDSLMAVVRSNLDLSLERFLEPSREDSTEGPPEA